MPLITPELVRNATRPLDDDLRLRERFVHGDAWLDGSGWPGGVPVSRFDSFASAQNALKKAFAPLDVLSDLIGFHCDAVSGSWWLTPERPLQQDEAPTEAEQTLIDEAEALLTTWWDKREAHRTLRAALEPLLWANIRKPDERPLTVSPLRLLIPEAEITDGRVTARTPAEAALKLHLEAHSPTQAGRLVAGGVTVGYYYRYTRNGLTETEVHALGRYVDDDPRVRDLSVVMVYHADGLGDEGIAYPLNGPLLMHELTLTRLLITDGVLSEARQLNMVNTLKGINAKDHGFTQEDLVDIDIKGRWTNAAGDPISDEQAANDPGAKFAADEIPKGPNLTRAWESVRLTNADKSETAVKGQVIRHTPSSSQEFRDGKDDILDTLYYFARQYHRRLSGDGAASGESRIQAVQDFLSSLEPTGGQYVAAVQWVLTAVLRMAAHLAGQTGRYDSLAVRCKLKTTAVKPTPDMVRVLSEAREKGQIDTESWLELSGLSDDVDATLARMNAERVLKEGVAEKMALLLTLLDKGVVTTEQLAQEAVKLGLVEGTLNVA